MRPFDADELHAALGTLADRLQQRRANARLYVVGGAAMILAHGATHSTLDVDAAIEGDYQTVIDAVRGIARERNWPTTWLNEQATPYMPPPHRRDGITVLDHPHLRVDAASAAQMLAMKARAARRADTGDVRRLARLTGAGSVEQVERLVADAFGSSTLDDRQRQWLNAVLAARG
ncbi:DUF6036 family nucleotidyltransferase [Candidatus Poriferisodalis sp.]|uniref:DUF6036 family nucleotidyltransferase n=1 Tax=Candidatus Poriferisodalis sp. TaxID=3101277 RepID=UPI003B02A8B9